MRAFEFLTERKKSKRRGRKLSKYFFPGYGYYGVVGSGESGDTGGGDGGGGESVYEAPELELAKRLPSLAKHDYNTIDKLMKQISKSNNDPELNNVDSVEDMLKDEK